MANYLEEKSGEYLEEIPIGKCYKIAGKCFGEDSGKHIKRLWAEFSGQDI